MGIAYAALIIVYVFICFFLILVVLVQQGKGADIAGAFGGGGTRPRSGRAARRRFLHKLTTGAFIGFIVIALVLTVLEAPGKAFVIVKACRRPPPPRRRRRPAPVPAAAAPAAPKPLRSAGAAKPSGK